MQVRIYSARQRHIQTLFVRGAASKPPPKLSYMYFSSRSSSQLRFAKLSCRTTLAVHAIPVLRDSPPSHVCTPARHRSLHTPHLPMSCNLGCHVTELHGDPNIRSPAPQLTTFMPTVAPNSSCTRPSEISLPRHTAGDTAGAQIYAHLKRTPKHHPASECSLLPSAMRPRRSRDTTNKVTPPPS